MTEYIEALRNLADWLESNELPEDCSFNTGSILNSIDFHTDKAGLSAVMAALGGEFNRMEHPTVEVYGREPSFLGFTYVEVYVR